MPEQISVRGLSYPGETERFGIPNGFRFYGNNDVGGDTDKLVTQTIGLEIGKTFKQYSFAIGWERIFITPIFKTKFGTDQLSPPIVEKVGDFRLFFLRQAYTYLLGEWGLKFQFNALYIDARDHGGKDFQEPFHNLIDSPYELDGYDPVIHFGITGSGAVELLIPKFDIFGVDIGLSLGAGKNITYFFNDEYRFASLAMKFTKGYVIYGKYSWVDQVKSDFFGSDYSTKREQSALGFRIHKYFFPHISRVSTYINGDKHGQTYKTLLNYAVDF